MTDYAPGEVPDVQMVTDVGDQYSIRGNLEYQGMVGATDIPNQWSIPHFKPEEEHLLKLFGVMTKEKWVDTGVEVRTGAELTPAGIKMMRDMMEEVVYQLKARNNSLSLEEQGVLKHFSQPVARVETITNTLTTLPPHFKMVLMDVLVDLMDFDNMSQLSGLAGQLQAGIQEKLNV